MKYLKEFEAFGQNGMFDWKVADMKHTPSSRAQFGLDQDDEFEYFDDEDEVCPNCDCIPCQCTGDECEECGCFPCECNDDIKENTQHKEGTFVYYNAMTKEELKSLQKTFKHDFENPAQHDPKFVAYLKACELKKVFKDKDQTPRNLKSNKMY